MDFATVATFVIPLIIAITLHEAAHGFVANLLGDNTAKLKGRVTFNPFKHIDPFGTLILPGALLLAHSPALFGYAKPVPVNFRNLKHRRSGTLLVALAGPGVNLLLAFISALLLHIEVFVTPEQAPWLFANLYNSVAVNVVLAAFNMLPILPLDGGRVLGALLPPKLASLHARTERFGMAIVLLIFMLPAMLHRSDPAHAFNPSYYLIGVPAQFLGDGIFHLAGIGNG